MSAATADTRMARSEAIEIAKAFVAELEGTYDQLIVAGSLRRRLARIGDIEVCAVPKIETRVKVTPGLFGDTEEALQVDLLGERMEHLLDAGTVQKRPRSDGKMFWGPSAKYLMFGGAPVDLFTPCAERFGWILAIRTGPWKWSNALVTHVGKKTREGRNGLLPTIYQSADGWLTYKTSGERIVTPDERTVFELLKLRWLEPWERL